MDIFAYGEI